MEITVKRNGYAAVIVGHNEKNDAGFRSYYLTVKTDWKFIKGDFITKVNSNKEYQVGQKVNVYQEVNSKDRKVWRIA